MKKLLKALVRAVTDGGMRVNFDCPFELGLECPRKCGAEECTTMNKTGKRLKKGLRKCWKKLIEKAEGCCE